MKNLDDIIKGKLLEEIERDETVTLWLSFADDDGFLGVVILKTLGFTHAFIETKTRGINPGGEIKGFEIDPENIDAKYFNRLLTRDEAQHLSEVC